MTINDFLCKCLISIAYSLSMGFNENLAFKLCISNPIQVFRCVVSFAVLSPRFHTVRSYFESTIKEYVAGMSLAYEHYGSFQQYFTGLIWRARPKMCSIAVRPGVWKAPYRHRIASLFHLAVGVDTKFCLSFTL
jgi:hypothetical protein